MRCQDVERILTGETTGPGTDAGIAAGLEGHLVACPACAAFQADLARIRGHVRGLTPPALPPGLDARTRAAWRSELLEPRPAPLPRWLWAALGVLTGLTAVVVYPVFAAPEIVEPLSFRTAAAIALLLQNGVMLFFAPILFRKFKKRPGPSWTES